MPAGAPVAPTGGIARAVRTYLDHLSVERGLAANTLTSYRRDLRRYPQYLAERGIEDLAGISESTVTDFLVRLREGDAEHPPLSSTSRGPDRRGRARVPPVRGAGTGWRRSTRPAG